MSDIYQHAHKHIARSSYSVYRAPKHDVEVQRALSGLQMIGPLARVTKMRAVQHGGTTGLRSEKKGNGQCAAGQSLSGKASLLASPSDWPIRTFVWKSCDDDMTTIFHVVLKVDICESVGCSFNQTGMGLRRYSGVLPSRRELGIVRFVS